MESKRKLSEILNELMNEYGTDLVAVELSHVKSRRTLYYELIRLFIAYDCYMVIFLQYLTLEDICRLDGAIKCSKLRPIWLRNLANNCCQNDAIVNQIKNDASINWCYIKSLKFKSVHIDKKFSSGVTDDGLLKLAKCCENVKRLSITDMTKFSGKGLSSLAEGCPNLQELIATNTLCNESLKAFGTYCCQLNYVQISKHRDLNDAYVIKSDGIHALKKNCKSLKTFKYFHELSGAEETSFVQSFPENCDNLKIETLHLNNIIVCDQYMKALAYSCRLLKSINFDRACITDQGLRAIGENCPMLESVSLHDIGTRPEARKYTDDGIKALAVGCRLLKVFNIAGTSLTNDHSIIALAKYCPLLEDVCLNSYIASDAGFLELGKLQHLKFIEIWKCSNITDNSISSLLEHNRSIKQMRIGCMAIFTDKLLSSISANCPNIESLSFVDMGTDSMSIFAKEALMDLVEKCKKLNHIHLNTVLPDIIKIELDKRKEGNEDTIVVA